MLGDPESKHILPYCLHFESLFFFFLVPHVNISEVWVFAIDGARKSLPAILFFLKEINKLIIYFPI